MNSGIERINFTTVLADTSTFLFINILPIIYIIIISPDI